MSDHTEDRTASRASIESAEAAFRAPRALTDDIQQTIGLISGELRNLSNTIAAFNADLPADDPSRIALPKGFVIAVRCFAEHVIADATEQRWVFPGSLNLVPEDHVISAGPGDDTGHALSPGATGRGNPVVRHPVRVTQYRPALTDVVAVPVRYFSESIYVSGAAPSEILTLSQVLPPDTSPSTVVRP